LDSDDAFGTAVKFRPAFRQASSNVSSTVVKKTDLRTPRQLRACGFTAFNDQLDWPRDIRNLLAVLRAPFTAWNLEEVDIDLTVFSELNFYFSATYIPASSVWVRLPSKRDVNKTNNGSRDESFDTWVIRRADIQLLAKTSLSMAWHIEGYLLGGNRLSRWRNLLSAAAIDSLRLLVRVQEHPASLSLSVNQIQALTDAWEPAIQKGLTKEDRIAFHTLYKLDTVLRELLEVHDLAAKVVGILVITNEEFRSLVIQSAIYLDLALVSARIILDIPNAVLRTPFVLGINQEFGVDFATWYPNGGIPNSIFPINLSTVILAVVKACVRSALLEAT
jgi:hypothetical protein